MGNFLAYTIIGIVLAVIGFMVWAKNDLCSTYYPEMHRAACFVTSTTLPAKQK